MCVFGSTFRQNSIRCRVQFWPKKHAKVSLSFSLAEGKNKSVKKKIFDLTIIALSRFTLCFACNDKKKIRKQISHVPMSIDSSVVVIAVKNSEPKIFKKLLEFRIVDGRKARNSRPLRSNCPDKLNSNASKIVGKSSVGCSIMRRNNSLFSIHFLSIFFVLVCCLSLSLALKNRTTAFNKTGTSG